MQKIEEEKIVCPQCGAKVDQKNIRCPRCLKILVPTSCEECQKCKSNKCNTKC